MSKNLAIFREIWLMWMIATCLVVVVKITAEPNDLTLGAVFAGTWFCLELGSMVWRSMER